MPLERRVDQAKVDELVSRSRERLAVWVEEIRECEARGHGEIRARVPYRQFHSPRGRVNGIWQDCEGFVSVSYWQIKWKDPPRKKRYRR